ncbi:MAG: Hydrolase, alpha/beta fold family, partial [uncultured Rubrobacteraceae bacterium]
VGLLLLRGARPAPHRVRPAHQGRRRAGAPGGRLGERPAPHAPGRLRRVPAGARRGSPRPLPGRGRRQGPGGGARGRAIGAADPRLLRVVHGDGPVHRAQLAQRGLPGVDGEVFGVQPGGEHKPHLAHPALDDRGGQRRPDAHGPRGGGLREGAGAEGFGDREWGPLRRLHRAGALGDGDPRGRVVRAVLAGPAVCGGGDGSL